MKRMGRIAGGDVSWVVPRSSSFPASAFARRITVLLAAYALVLSGFTLSGCDAINSILGSDDVPEVPPNTGSDSPEGPLEPLAFSDGDEPEIIPVDENDPSKGIYEIHTFRAREDQNTFTLALTVTQTYQLPPGAATIQNVDYFIVAGGGGAGGNCNDSDRGGGGGAGGLRYQAGQTLTLGNGGSVTVTVGNGGAGGAMHIQGDNGEDSAIGALTAGGGGGGGAGNGGNANLNGKPGGSGGGSGAGRATDAGTRGTASGNGLGHDGGTAGPESGGGGGGAGGAGQNVSTNNAPGVGGASWSPSENDGWAWVEDITGTSTFSRGGRGGSYIAAAEGAPGANYGDGGDGNNATSAKGNAGHDGIVIIRFRRSASGAS